MRRQKHYRYVLKRHLEGVAFFAEGKRAVSFGGWMISAFIKIR